MKKPWETTISTTREPLAYVSVALILYCTFSAALFIDRAIKLYQPLLANNEQEAPNAQPEVAETVDKTAQNHKALGTAIVGSHFVRAGLKLSDFIDAKFLDELDQSGTNVDQSPYGNRIRMSELIGQLESESRESLIDTVAAFTQANKRQKTGDQTLHSGTDPV